MLPGCAKEQYGNVADNSVEINDVVSYRFVNFFNTHITNTLSFCWKKCENLLQLRIAKDYNIFPTK